jgi:hypothetical protein
MITKLLPLNHLVFSLFTRSNCFFRLSRLVILFTFRSLDTSVLMCFWSLFAWELAILSMISATVSIPRSQWMSLLRTYHGALTVHFSTSFWQRWMTWMLVLTGAAPKLDTITPNWTYDLLVYSEFVVGWQCRRPDWSSRRADPTPYLGRLRSRCCWRHCCPSHLLQLAALPVFTLPSVNFLFLFELGARRLR